MDVLSRARRTIRRYGLADSGTGVVAAVSGGSDSVALAYLLKALDEAGECRLIGLAHFNHRLRAQTADRDQAFCVHIAESLGRPLVVDTADVRALAAREKRSIEGAARTA